MASVALARAAFRGTRALRATASVETGGTKQARQQVKEGVLKQGASRDPELYVLLTVMTGAFGLAGYFFARSPTSSSSEQPVGMAADSEPWQTETKGKYQYYPGGDTSKAVRDAPSALHSVTIPNVNLPAHLHEQFNKYDTEEYDDY